MTSESGGTSPVTTLPADTTEPAPMCTPGSTKAPCAIETSSSSTMGPCFVASESRRQLIDPNRQRRPMRMLSRQSITTP